MKILKLIILFTASAMHLCAQENINTQKERLVNEIKTFDYIESRCLGIACNSYSVLYKKADSLFRICTHDDMIRYFEDSSSSLKYYSFVHILEFDDALTFELLKNNIHNTKYVDYQFADLSSRARLITLLGLEYEEFIYSKYFFGGIVCKDQNCIQFPKKNRKVFRKKKRQLETLFSTNNIKIR